MPNQRQPSAANRLGAERRAGASWLGRRDVVAGSFRTFFRYSLGPTRWRLPVVLVHGLGLSGRYMLPTAEHLAPHFPVYVPELPGFGDSAKPAHALDVPALAEALAACIAAMDLARDQRETGPRHRTRQGNREAARFAPGRSVSRAHGR